MRKIFGVIALFSLFYRVYTQPQVTKEFTKTLVSEDFSNLSGKWQEMSTSENLITGSAAGYEVWRKNRKSGFFAFPETRKELQFFEISVSFSFSPKGNKNQSAGLILQIPEKNNGGVVIEINRKGQFRTLRAVNNNLFATSGGEEGWIKTSGIVKQDNNTLLIRTYDKIYDLYLNGKYLYTFTEIDYTKGSYGLYTGADSRIVFQKLEIKTDEEPLTSDNNNPDKVDQDKTLSQIIIRLRENINKKEKRITELEEALKNNAVVRQGVDTVSLRQRNECERNLLGMQLELNNLKSENERLQSQVEMLEEFKKQVKSSENGDIVINLTQINNNQKDIIKERDKTITNMKLETERLNFDKADLRQQITSMQTENDQLRNDKLSLEFRVFEKDSLLTDQAEKIKLLESSLEACYNSGNASATTKKEAPQEAEKKKKKKKKKEDEQTLFVE